MLKKVTFLIFFITCCCPLLGSIKAEESLWGFDGKILPQNFNMVSILFSNPSPEAFEGTIKLQKLDGAGGKLGAPQIQNIFLGPYAYRWVQFYPYLRNGGETWLCSWGRGKDRIYVLNAPRKGPKSVVFFKSSNSSFSSKKIRIRSFPENLFPPSVSLTDGLRAAVLEETPEFTPLQNEAFINWIKAGGYLYLLPDNNGLYPRFQGKSAIINSSASEVKIGHGLVKKLPRDINFISAGSIGVPNENKLKLQDAKGENILSQQDYRIAGITDDLFRKLRYDVKTNHNWGLIAFITVIYLILIVVVNFIIARKTRKLWPPLIFFGITVFVFSLLFAFIGRRGYGERSQVSSISFARSLGDGNFDVSQWMNIFVTSGDYYRISHNSPVNFYSTCQTMEKVNGEVNNGAKGDFYVDIPLFSSRSLFHRAMINDPGSELENVDFTDRDGELVKLDIKLKKDFSGKVLKACAIYKGYYYNLVAKRANDQWELSFNLQMSGSPIKISEFYQQWNDYGYYRRYGDRDDEDFTKVVEKMVEPLIIRNLPDDDNKVNIYIMGESPPGFAAKADQIKRENGFVMYYFKLKGKK